MKENRKMMMEADSRFPVHTIAIAILAVFLLVTMVWSGYTGYEAVFRPTFTPTATMTPTPTATPTSTSTSTPTSTPVPTPTNTDTPTPTPRQIALIVQLLGNGAILADPGEVGIFYGNQAVISANTAGDNLVFVWSLDGRGDLLESSDARYVTYIPPETGFRFIDATVSVQIDDGESQVGASVIFHVEPPPTPTFTPTPTRTPTPTPTPTYTPSPTPSQTSIPSSAPIAMRLDAVAAPEGWMSGGANPADFISLEGNPGGCYSGSDCTRWTYRTGASWAGVLYWPFGCTWDTVNSRTCGINVLSEGGFSAVHRLSFWARGEHGGERIEFTIGSDSGGIPPTPRRSLGTVTLGSGWQRYEINLSGVGLSNAIALFYWGASDDNNPGGAVFYLDDVQFEGVQ